jgi:hypothetical protein
MHSTTSKAAESGEASHSSSEAETIILTEKVICLVLSASFAFLTVATTVLLIHSLTAEAEATHHKIVLFEEVSEGIPASKEVSEYVLGMLESEISVESGRPAPLV